PRSSRSSGSCSTRNPGVSPSSDGRGRRRSTRRSRRWSRIVVPTSPSRRSSRPPTTATCTGTIDEKPLVLQELRPCKRRCKREGRFVGGRFAPSGHVGCPRQEGGLVSIRFGKRKIAAVLAFVLAAVIGVSAYAFTASNTVAEHSAGAGAATVSGY